MTEGILSLLDLQIDDDYDYDYDDVEVTWAGRKVDIRVRRLAPQEEEEHVIEPGEGYVPAGPRDDHPPAWENPSSMKGEGTAKEPVQIGNKIEPKGRYDDKHLGEAIHGFFAADIDGLKESDRLSIAEGLLERWEVAESLSPADLLKAGDALKTWAKKRWPDAKWRREIPMAYRNQRGSVVRGICDLALDTKEGWVVIDHKSYQDADRAAEAAPQLKAYSDGIAATDRSVQGCWIHLPLLGVVVPVKSKP